MKNLTQEQQNIIAVQNEINPSVDWEHIVRNLSTLKHLVSTKRMKYVTDQRTLVIFIAQEMYKKAAKAEKKAKRKSLLSFLVKEEVAATKRMAKVIAGAVISGLSSSLYVFAATSTTSLTIAAPLFLAATVVSTFCAIDS